MLKLYEIFDKKLASNEFSLTRNIWFYIENLLDKK